MSGLDVLLVVVGAETIALVTVLGMCASSAARELAIRGAIGRADHRNRPDREPGSAVSRAQGRASVPVDVVRSPAPPAGRPGRGRRAPTPPTSAGTSRPA